MMSGDTPSAGSKSPPDSIAFFVIPAMAGQISCP